MRLHMMQGFSRQSFSGRVPMQCRTPKAPANCSHALRTEPLMVEPGITSRPSWPRTTVLLASRLRKPLPHRAGPKVVILSSTSNQLRLLDK